MTSILQLENFQEIPLQSIYRFIQNQVDQWKKKQNGFCICILEYNSKDKTIQISSQLVCQKSNCLLNQFILFGEKLLQTFFYLLNDGQIYKKEILGFKCSGSFIKENFKYFKIFPKDESNNNKEFQNLKQVFEFANTNDRIKLLSYRLIEFPRYFLKFVNVMNGTEILEINNINAIQIGLSNIVKFIIDAQVEKIEIYPICQHNINIGQQDDNNVQLQMISFECNDNNCSQNKNVSKSIGLYLQSSNKEFDHSIKNLIENSRLFNRINNNGDIKSLEIIYQILIEKSNVRENIYQNVKYISSVNTETYIEYAIQNISNYKLFFIRNTIFESIKYLTKKQEFKSIKCVLFILENYYKQQQNVQGLNQFYNNQEILKSIQNQIGDNINIDFFNFNILNFYHFLAKSFKCSPFILQFRIRCCIIFDYFFKYENISKNMLPYLKLTQFKNGIDMEQFEQWQQQQNFKSDEEIEKQLQLPNQTEFELFDSILNFYKAQLKESEQTININDNNINNIKNNIVILELIIQTIQIIQQLQQQQQQYDQFQQSNQQR